MSLLVDIEKDTFLPLLATSPKNFPQLVFFTLVTTLYILNSDNIVGQLVNMG
jgi:hypothetical protein